METECRLLSSSGSGSLCSQRKSPLPGVGGGGDGGGCSPGGPSWALKPDLVSLL